MKQKIILLFANQYSIRDENTRELKEGISCNYYFNTDLAPVSNNDGAVGTRPAKGSMPLDCFFKIKTAPAVYEATFDMKIGSDGKPILSIIDLDFIEEICIVPASSVKAAKAG